jgi:DNA excision repair protein ERCC-6-like
MGGDGDFDIARRFQGLVVLSSSSSSSSSSESGCFADDNNDDNSGSNVDDEMNSLDGSAWTLSSTKTEYYLQGISSHVDNHSDWPKISIPADFFRTLYDFQHVAVEWMASLHAKGVGGILGDDMGMGKTYMTLTLLGGLMRSGTIRNALVISPVSVMRAWECEAEKVLRSAICPLASIDIVSSHTAASKRAQVLQSALNSNRPTLIISSFGLVRSSTSDFVNAANGGRGWDYVLIDEGHTIKNPTTGITKACHSICRASNTRRLLLTGTPLQNNLEELWTLFDWVTAGTLLGSKSDFQCTFAQPIEAAREKDASPQFLREGDRINKALQKLLKPYFLQRLKIDFLRDKLPTKTELVVWTHISNDQRARYESYCSKELRSLDLGKKVCPLSDIAYLKKLCGHLLIADENKVNEFKVALQSQDVDQLLRHGPKLEILLDLVKRFAAYDHKVLIFSQSARMLDILEKTLGAEDVTTCRLDGQTKEKLRQQYVDKFNEPSSTITAMLLSTKAAGVGLTLTGADRVIIYDPSWTPTEDTQAVDRCYRIGQTRPVLVYRLVAAGTVEEKMYEKQVYKDGIRRTVLTENVSFERHFNRAELSRLFEITPKEKLARKGDASDLAKVISDVAESSLEIDSLRSHPQVVEVTRHDVFYKGTVPSDVQEPELVQEVHPSIGKAQRIHEKVVNEPTPPIKTSRSTATDTLAKENLDGQKPSNDPMNRVAYLLNEVNNLAFQGRSQQGLEKLMDFFESDEFREADRASKRLVDDQIWRIILSESMLTELRRENHKG